jgi:tRNA (Thr-GGU) A37 N-methylase
VRAVLEKYIEVMLKKPYEDGFQSLQNYQKWKILIILHEIKSRLNKKSHVLTFLEAIL